MFRLCCMCSGNQTQILWSQGKRFNDESHLPSSLQVLKPSMKFPPSLSSHLHKAHLQVAKPWTQEPFWRAPPLLKGSEQCVPLEWNSALWKGDPGLLWIESYLSYWWHPTRGEITELSLLLISKMCLRWINALSWNSTLDQEQGQSLHTYHIKPTVLRLSLILPPVRVSPVRKRHFAFCDFVCFPHGCFVHRAWIPSLLSNL